MPKIKALQIRKTKPKTKIQTNSVIKTLNRSIYCGDEYFMHSISTFWQDLFEALWIFDILRALQSLSLTILISRYILRLGQAAQKQQRPSCPNPKMYLEIRKAVERLFSSWSRAKFASYHEYEI